MCEAYTKGCRRCRAYAHANGLCKAHQSFYKGIRPYAFVLRHYTYTVSHRTKKHLTNLLKSRHLLSQNPDGIRMIESLSKGIHIEGYPEVEPYLKERASYLYEYMVSIQVIRPDSIPSLWADLVVRNTKLIPYFVNRAQLLNSDLPNPKLMEYLYGCILPYFTSGTTDAQLAAFFGQFRRGLGMFEEQTAAIYTFSNTGHYWKQQMRNILTKILLNIPKHSEPIQNTGAFLQQMNEAHAAWPNSLWHSVRLHVEGILVCEAANEKERMRTTNRPLKEELYAVALHPDRIAKYIRAGIRPSDL